MVSTPLWSFQPTKSDPRTSTSLVARNRGAGGLKLNECRTALRTVPAHQTLVLCIHISKVQKHSCVRHRWWAPHQGKNPLKPSEGLGCSQPSYLLSRYFFFAVFLRKLQRGLMDDLHFLQFFTMLVLRIHISITAILWRVAYRLSSRSAHSQCFQQN